MQDVHMSRLTHQATTSGQRSISVNLNETIVPDKLTILVSMHQLLIHTQFMLIFNHPMKIPFQQVKRAAISTAKRSNYHQEYEIPLSISQSIIKSHRCGNILHHWIDDIEAATNKKSHDVSMSSE